MKSMFVFWIKYFVGLCLPFTHAGWLQYGQTSVSINTDDVDCYKIHGLVPKQIELCKKHPDFLKYVGKGIRLAIDECQNVFRLERWNCTTINDSSVFGPILNHGTRETAFIHAIISAGVTYTITQYLATQHCYKAKSCGKSPQERCKIGMNYAVDFSREFVNAPDLQQHQNIQPDVRRMNIHNKLVGRKMIKKLRKLRCQCYGITYSCCYVGCWIHMPNFHLVARKLKAKYERALPLVGSCRGKACRENKPNIFGKQQKHPLQIVGESGERERAPTNELVFLQKSPDYCSPNLKEGITGTNGRICNVPGIVNHKCNHICCERGYTTQDVNYFTCCHFDSCCQFDSNGTCRLCETTFEKHTCM